MNNPEREAGMSGTLRDNIAAMRARRGRERAAAPWPDRTADRITAFAGSMLFILIHLALFGGWIAWNLWGTPKFDPSFVVLAMFASVEAIFLSTFVLISQNRMQAAADARAELDLHINLLAEHELSRVADLVGRIAAAVGVEVDRAELREIAADVKPDVVLDALSTAER